jgi:hypothetical protein
MRRMRGLVAAVSVLVSAGCASTPLAPPSVNVTGKWQGTWQFEQVSMGSGQIVMDLKQVGAQLTGDVLVTGPAMNRPTTIQATVTGNDIKLEGRIPGTLTVTGDQMSGVVYGVLEANLTLRRLR